MTKEKIVVIDVEVFKNLSQMLQSSNNEDIQMALETIKNLNPCEELIRLFLKKTTYQGRSALIEMLGQSKWGFNDLTMAEIYNCIKGSKDSNIDNIKKIYETLVLEHFQHLTKEYNFIDGKYEVIW